MVLVKATKNDVIKDANIKKDLHDLEMLVDAVEWEAREHSYDSLDS